LKYAPPAIIRGIGITLGSMLLLFCLIAQPWRLRFGFVRRLNVPWRVNDRQEYRGPDTDGLTARSSSPNHQGDWPQPGRKRRQPVI
jgi:hypothetical protein